MDMPGRHVFGERSDPLDIFHQQSFSVSSNRFSRPLMLMTIANTAQDSEGYQCPLPIRLSASSIHLQQAISSRWRCGM